MKNLKRPGMQRSYLKVGDKSSAGGTVIEGIPSVTHEGVELTFVGAQVSCPACKSVGHIVAKGPRLPGSMMGKTRALEGDICLCKCSPPPVMIASQSVMSETLQGHEMALQGFAANGLPLAPESPGNFDERVRVLDAGGQPLAGVPFHIKTPSGEIHKGMTDVEGYCPRVFTSDAQQLDIAIGHQAVQRWNA